jgi:hypothetical protein
MANPTTRKECIKNNQICPGLFQVTGNPNASDNPPYYEIGYASNVKQYSGFIDSAALAKNVEARLIRAIMYIEETHGYYDAPLNLIGVNKSIRPMNINVAYWGDTFGTREDMQDVKLNIFAGAEMLRRILNNMPPGSAIEKIATLYNNINATVVNNYGMRTKTIYSGELWK